MEKKAEGRNKGYVHNDSSKRLMSLAKLGNKHPKYIGLYCFRDVYLNKEYKSTTPAGLIALTGEKTTPMTIYRRCKNDKVVNYWIERPGVKKGRNCTVNMVYS